MSRCCCVTSFRSKQKPEWVRVQSRDAAKLGPGGRPPTGLDLFYVELTRARGAVAVLTDDREALIETLETATGEELSALKAIGEQFAVPVEATVRRPLRKRALVVEDGDRHRVDRPARREDEHARVRGVVRARRRRRRAGPPACAVRRRDVHRHRMRHRTSQPHREDDRIRSSSIQDCMGGLA